MTGIVWAYHHFRTNGSWNGWEALLAFPFRIRLNGKLHSRLRILLVVFIFMFSVAAPPVNATAHPELSIDARNTSNISSVPHPSYSSFTAIWCDTVPVVLLLMACLSILGLVYLTTTPQRLNFAPYMPLVVLIAVYSCLCLTSASPTDEQPSTPVDVGNVSILDILCLVGSCVSILGLLYLATKKLERVVASKNMIRRNRLKITILSLAMILTATFTFPVTSVAQKGVSTVVIWAVAAITCYTILSGETTNEPSSS